MAIVYWVGTAADGDWNTTTNWSTSTVPIAGDDVTIDRTNDDINLNISSQSGVLLDSLTITQSFQGTIGDVPDASQEYLAIGATVVTMGAGEGNGSQRLNIDLGTDATTLNIINASSSGTDFPKLPVRIKANNASNVIQVGGVNSAVAFLDNPDDTGALGDIDVTNGSNIEIGAGATFTSFTQILGSSKIFEQSGTIKLNGGVLTLEGSTAIATVTHSGGELTWNSTGTITTYTARGGTLNTIASTFARTITTLTKSPGFTFNRQENITVTNDVFDSGFSDISITYS